MIAAASRGTTKKKGHAARKRGAPCARPSPLLQPLPHGQQRAADRAGGEDGDERRRRRREEARGRWTAHGQRRRPPAGGGRATDAARMARRAATGRHGRDAAATGRIQLGKGRIWPEEPAATAMAEEVGRGRDGRRADGDEEAATGEDEGAATTTAAAEEGGAENGRTAGCCCLRRWKGGKKVEIDAAPRETEILPGAAQRREGWRLSI